MKKKKFKVAIMHGHNKDYKMIETYVNECKFSPIILIDEVGAEIIFEKLRRFIWKDVHCAIVLLTKDDEMKDGNKRARQNVIFELGYCFGAFDSLPEKAKYQPKDALIVVTEGDVELFTDINGLITIKYETGKIQDAETVIKNSLNSSFKNAKKYF